MVGQYSMKTKTNNRKNPRKISFLIFLLPTFAAFCVGFLYPFLQGVYLSFCKFVLPGDAKWNGLQNYGAALSDAGFLYAFWYTALFAVVSIVLINVVSFAVAYSLTRGIRGENLFRTIFFMPNLIGGIVLGYIWSLIFDGVLRYYDTYLLARTSFGFWGLVLLMAWQQIGYMMIIYVAGLQSIPQSMLEAAQMDGAGGWQSLRRVVIPNIMPSVTICVFLTLTNSFKLFDQNLALTDGMPVTFGEGGTMINTTEMLALNIYKTFYAGAFSRGVAQAKAVLFFVLVAILALAQLRLTRQKEVQQ